MIPGDPQPAQEATARIYKGKMTTDQINLIRAHNASPNGLKLGVSKQDRKPASNTPIFKQDNQINIF